MEEAVPFLVCILSISWFTCGTCYLHRAGMLFASRCVVASLGVRASLEPAFSLNLLLLRSVAQVWHPHPSYATTDDITLVPRSMQAGSVA